MLVAKGYKVLMFDFYGHGFSSIPKVSYTIELFREQLEELLVKLELQDSPLILLGHSMGGLVASEFAGKHQERVAKVILLNSAGLPVAPTLRNMLPFAFQALCRVARSTHLFDIGAHLLARVMKLHGSYCSISYNELCLSSNSLDEEEEEKEVEERESSNKKGSFLSTLWVRAKTLVLTEKGTRFADSARFLYKTWMYQVCVSEGRSNVLLSILRDCPLLDANHSATFAKIKKANIPLLIIWGENDGVLPQSLLEDYRKCLPDATYLSLPGDHAVFLQKPMQVFDSILKFITGGNSLLLC